MASDKDIISSGSEAVYTGFWVDWDRGKILGATLTLQDKHAVPLLAALAILVTLAGNRSWYICRFLWHSFLRAKDAHGQTFKEHRRKQQVILRNAETVGGATLSLLEEWFDFGITKVLRECSPKDLLLGIFSFGHWISFIALGVLVSQIVLGQTVVSKALLSCGQWIPSKGKYTGREFQYINQELLLNQTINSDSYVRSCYSQGGSQGILDCNKFVTRSLLYRTEGDVSCPFQSTACLPDANSAFELESKNITFTQLGLNSKYSNEISVQRRSTCAVLDAELFKIDESKLAGNVTQRVYSFVKDEETGRDLRLPFRNNEFGDNYRLLSFLLVNDPEYIASPIRPRSNTSNEVSIVLLGGAGISFLEQQDDPFFSAHVEIKYNNETGIIPPGYRRYKLDNFLNLIACTEQCRFCSSVTSQCTEWEALLRSPLLSTANYTTLLGHNTITRNSSELRGFELSATLLQLAMQNTALHRSIQSRDAAALQAVRYLSEGEQLHLGPEQWKFELEYWFMMSLARLQLEIFNTIERPTNIDESRAENLWATEFPVLLDLCGRVKFRSPNHTSLSTLGFAIVIAFSGTLMLGSFIAMCLPSIRWTKRWKAVRDWQRDMVVALLEKTNDKYAPQLQDEGIEYSIVAVDERCKP